MIQDPDGSSEGLDFGSDKPADWIVTTDDLSAFAWKQGANSGLSVFKERIDGAGGAGKVDDHFSRRDWQALLDDPPEEFVKNPELAKTVQDIIDNKMYDQGWFEKHRNELATLAALGIAVGVTAVSLGSSSPITVPTIIALSTVSAGAGAATVTGGINANAGLPLTDGVAGNTIKGFMIGASVGSLPATFSAASGSGTGFQIMAARLGVLSESANVVASGGADVIVPDTAEGSVESVTGGVSAVTGFSALGMVGGRALWRQAIKQGARPLRAETAGDGTTKFYKTFNGKDIPVDSELLQVEKNGLRVDPESGFLIDADHDLVVIDKDNRLWASGQVRSFKSRLGKLQQFESELQVLSGERLALSKADMNDLATLSKAEFNRQLKVYELYKSKPLPDEPVGVEPKFSIDSELLAAEYTNNSVLKGTDSAEHKRAVEKLGAGFLHNRKKGDIGILGKWENPSPGKLGYNDYANNRGQIFFQTPDDWFSGLSKEAKDARVPLEVNMQALDTILKDGKPSCCNPHYMATLNFQTTKVYKQKLLI